MSLDEKKLSKNYIPLPLLLREMSKGEKNVKKESDFMKNNLLTIILYIEKARYQ